MPYRKPLLKEILAEVHLRPGSLGSAQFITGANALIAAGFSDVEFLQVGTLNVAPGGLGANTQVRLRCWTPGRTRCVQLSNDVVVVNHADLYPGRSAFLELVSEVLGTLAPVLGVVAADHVVLVTIDEVRAQGASRIGEWFRCDSHLAPVLANAAGPLQAVTQWDGGKRSVVVSMQHDTAKDETTIVLQSQFLGSATDPRTAVEALLEESSALFRTLVTPKAIEFMGGEL